MDNTLSSNCALSGSVSCGEGITSPTATTSATTPTTTALNSTTTTSSTNITTSSISSTTTTTATTTKPTAVSTLCKELINASKECGFDPAILLHLAVNGSGSGIHMIRVEDNVDEEHCEGFLEHLEEFCGIGNLFLMNS